MSIETFLEKEFKLSNGETIELPKLSWKKEIKIYKIIGNVTKKLNVTTEAEIKPMDMLKLVSEMLVELPEPLTEICTILTGKSKEWIEDNLKLEDVTALVFPFFNRFISVITEQASKIRPLKP